MNRKTYMTMKRCFDVVACAVGILVTSPIWLIAALGIMVCDPGPVFYRASRIGKDDKPFCMLKFRSMRVDKNADEKSFKADENRIFRFGAFMRATKIDELPQLWNVLVGDMSVVGPRPAAKDQAAVVRAGAFGAASKVKPGLTGPAALYDYIYGDTILDEAEYEEKVLPTRMKLDVFYVENMSVAHDLKMIWYTIVCILNALFHRSSSKLLDKILAQPQAFFQENDAVSLN